MDQQPLEINLTFPGNEKAVEAGLKTLWERVKRAAEVISQLREERWALLAKVEKLEGEVLHLRQELKKKEESQKISTQHQTGIDVKQGTIFSNGDRQVLASRVKELLAKLESYL